MYRADDQDTAKDFVKELFDINLTDHQVDKVTFIVMEMGWLDFANGEKVEKWFKELEENDGEYLEENEEED
jgi:Zn finger protein HypA/HybF involved in hydrogenase expression